VVSIQTNQTEAPEEKNLPFFAESLAVTSGLADAEKETKWEWKKRSTSFLVDRFLRNTLLSFLLFVVHID